MDIAYFKQAYQLNKDFKEILVKENVHFRANPNSLSLISVSKEKPEIGVKCNYINKSLEDMHSLILRDIEKIKTKTLPKRPTPEKELQSLIIQSALNNNHALPFDSDIKFITSELAILNSKGKKVVTDILGYSATKNTLYIIEIKSSRLLKRLVQQVHNFEEIVLSNKKFFSEILSIYGFSDKDDSHYKINKLIIWPHGKKSPLQKLKEESISEFTYHEDYSFSNFS